MNYEFSKPAASFELPQRLREISGLTRLDDQHLAAVQDEQGDLFVLDVDTGEIVDEHDFGKRGDYEGVELANGIVYVLDSDGDLFVVKDWNTRAKKARKIETALSAAQDTEGLAYDAKHNRLLILCKEDPGHQLENQRAIYAFDLQTETVLEKPAFTIHYGELFEHRSKSSGFKPAALAIHPLTAELYVVSSVLKVLVVFAPSGDLSRIYELPQDLFAQPEGMAFLSNGDLFIANEGKHEPATLQRFKATATSSTPFASSSPAD